VCSSGLVTRHYKLLHYYTFLDLDDNRRTVAKPPKNPGTQPRQLNERQRRFVEAFMGPAEGNATEAARMAGYSGNRQTLGVTGKAVLDKTQVRAAIDQRAAADPQIATRTERQQFWSGVMRGTIGRTVKDVDGKDIVLPAEMKDRLKAAELLGKTQADFIERVEVTGKDGGPMVTAGVDLTKLTVAEIETWRQLRSKAEG
jgi:phage terminase small subunit